MTPAGRFFYSRPGLGNLPDYSGGGPKPPIGIPPPAEYTAQAGQGGASPASDGMSDRQSYWQSLPFLCGLEAVKIQEFLMRKFFLIQNKDPLNTIYVGFGWKPDAGNALILGPGVGFEPFSYPVNEIWVSASGANSVGLLIVGT